METLGRVLAGLLGTAVVLATLASAIRTVVLPRGVPSHLTRAVFTTVRFAYRLRLGRAPSYERRDTVLATYAPVSLLLLLQTWLVLVLTGFAGLHWAVAGHAVRRSLSLSGSSLLTLGVSVPRGSWSTALTFAEASIGLVLVALLISYLPALYGSFSRREHQVARMAVRAGEPPTGTVLVSRVLAVGNQERLDEIFQEMEGWFIELEESHTSFPSLVFFRSPQPQHSWVTTAGAVLDGAAFRTAVVDLPRTSDAQLCLRAGFLALRRIADFYDVPYPPDPQPGDPITITRDEFDQAVAALVAGGVRVVADLDQAWVDWSGWRVNYDVPLLALANLTAAPYAPWSSDRSLTDIPVPARAGGGRRGERGQ